MNAEEHNRIIGYLFLAYLGLQVLSLIITGIAFVFFFRMFRTMPLPDPNFFLWFGIVMAVTLVISVALLIPIAVAAYQMLKQKPTARPWGIAASIISLLGIPLGTIIGVYGLWYFFSEEGKAYYLGGPIGFIPPPPPPENWR